MTKKLSCALLLVLLFSGCAWIPIFRKPPLPPPDVEYTSLIERIDSLDTSGLKGKTVIIDPGHGGHYPGVVGKGGTREADVNLKVALKLSDLLKSKGANVILTRSEDKDLLPSDSLNNQKLRDDLKVRTDISNQAGADLFVSIHHNSMPSVDINYNSTETFYKMTDPGPSLDAGRLLHKHLVRNLRSKNNKFLPGNYFILRENSRPAILGEASHLSNPRIERKLLTPEAQLLEAQSYFLGIVDYFDRRIPRVKDLFPNKTVIDHARPTITAIVQDEEGGAGIDPETLILKIDGEVVKHTYTPETGQVTYTPPKPLENGEHKVSLSVRNLRGNSSEIAYASFVTSSPPANIYLTALPAVVPADSLSKMMIKAYVEDANGNPVLNETPVIFSDETGRLNETVLTKDGTARLYLLRDKPMSLKVSATCKDISNSVNVRFGRIEKPLLIAEIFDSITGSRLSNAECLVDGDSVLYTNEDGYLALEELGQGTHLISISKDGYKPSDLIVEAVPGRSNPVQVKLVPIANGVLHDHSIVIDPAFGGEEKGFVGPTGTYASDLNLGIAKYLATYMKTAGAKVILTRSSDVLVTLPDRVRKSVDAKAEVFLSISLNSSEKSRVDSSLVGYYPRSEKGEALAKAIQEGLATGLKKEASTYKDVSYIIQNTSCPAVLIDPASLSDPATEEALSYPSYLRAIAYMIYTGLLKYYDLQSHASVEGYVKDEKGNPIFGALLIIDDYLPIQTDRDGRFIFRYLEPGEHVLSSRLEGFKPLDVKIRLSSDETRRYDMVLHPLTNEGAEEKK